MASAPTDPVALLASYRYHTSRSKPLNWSAIRSVDIQRLTTTAPDLQQMKQLTAAVVDCALDQIKIPALMDASATGAASLLTPMDTVQLLRAMQVALQFTLHSQTCLRETYVATRDLLTSTQLELGKLRGVSNARADTSSVATAVLQEREHQWALERAQLQASLQRIEAELKRSDAARTAAETALQSRVTEVQSLSAENALLKGQIAALMHDLRAGPARTIAASVEGVTVKAAPSWLLGAQVVTEATAKPTKADAAPAADAAADAAADVRRSHRVKEGGHRHHSSSSHRHHHHRRSSSSDGRTGAAASVQPQQHHSDVASVVSMMQQLLTGAAQQQQAHLLSVQTLQQITAQQQQQPNGGTVSRRGSLGSPTSAGKQQSDEFLRHSLGRLQSSLDDLRADVRRLEQLQGRDAKVFNDEMARLDDELRRVEQLQRQASDVVPVSAAGSDPMLADRLTLVDRAVKSLRDEMNQRLQEQPTPQLQHPQLNAIQQQVAALSQTVDATAKEHTQRLDALGAKVAAVHQSDSTVRAALDDLRARTHRHDEAIAALSTRDNALRPALAPVVSANGSLSRAPSAVNSPVVSNPVAAGNTAAGVYGLPASSQSQPHSASQQQPSRGNSARTSDYGDVDAAPVSKRAFYDDSEEEDPNLCPHCARPHPNLATHVANCGYRPENCRYCGERYSIQSKELHLAHCKEYNRPAALREEALAQQRVATPNTSVVTPSASFVAPVAGDLDQSGSAVLSASAKAPPPTPAIASGRAKTKELKALNDELAALMAEEAEAEARKQQLAMGGAA